MQNVLRYLHVYSLKSHLFMLYTIDRVCACVCACVRACVEDYFDCAFVIVQELCESRGGRPGLSVLTSLLASVDVKIY